MSTSADSDKTTVYNPTSEPNEFIGMITNYQKALSKDGLDMCFFMVEIHNKVLKVNVFPSVFSTCSFVLEDGKEVKMTGIVFRDDESGDEMLLPDVIEETKMKVLDQYSNPSTEYFIKPDDFWHEINGEFKESGGIYILKCSQNGTLSAPTPINRILKTDNNGILYIGKANSFLDRVINLKKSIMPNYKSQNHECGTTFKNHKQLSSKFPFEYLYVQLIPSGDPIELENKLLTEYEKEFGELPPLNRQG